MRLMSPVTVATAPKPPGKRQEDRLKKRSWRLPLLLQVRKRRRPAKVAGVKLAAAEKAAGVKLADGDLFWPSETGKKHMPPAAKSAGRLQLSNLASPHFSNSCGLVRG